LKRTHMPALISYVALPELPTATWHSMCHM
jgi:hypothetical protein